MNGKPLPLDTIAKIAADIREIKDFAENHGFDTSLVQATVNPGSSASSFWDWPVTLLIIFTIMLVALLAGLTFIENLPPKVSNFLLVVGMLFVIGASAAAHRKFENNIITMIVGIGMTVVLLVGGGVFTPREAADRVQEMRK